MNAVMISSSSLLDGTVLVASFPGHVSTDWTCSEGCDSSKMSLPPVVLGFARSWALGRQDRSIASGPGMVCPAKAKINGGRPLSEGLGSRISFSTLFLDQVREGSRSPVQDRSSPGSPRKSVQTSKNRIGSFDIHDFSGDAPRHSTGYLGGLARINADCNDSSFPLTGTDACDDPGILRPSEYLPLPPEDSLQSELAIADNNLQQRPGTMLHLYLSMPNQAFLTIA